MKKNYVVAVKNPSDWETVHNLLTQDGTLEDNIPSRACECTDEKTWATLTSTYLLDEDEVNLLLGSDKVASVQIDGNFHFAEREALPAQGELVLRAVRYAATTKHYRDGFGVPATATAAELDRAGYQIARLTAKNDSWNASDYSTQVGNYEGQGNHAGQVTQDYRTSTVLTQQITYTNDGTDVDVVVSDDACWLAHPEFVENGVSTVRDLVLDGPFYLDPGAFSNAQRTTYLGRTTSTEQAARDWWSDTTNRTATFAAAFGNITIGAGYTRAGANGSNAALATWGNHGTTCASQAYGKNFGWAFNSNKWFIHYGNEASTLSQETHWNIIELFHLNKLDNATYGNKNPLVVSASWGINYTVPTSGHISYRGSSTSYTSSTIPAAVRHFNSKELDNSQPMSYSAQIPASTATAAGDQLANQAGVFIFNASGNSNQANTCSGDPDYNNYWNSTNAVPGDVGQYFNRIGYPGNLGADNDSPNKYLAFSIGAMHDAVLDDGGTKKEQRVDYSNMGTGLDLYAPAHRTLGANNNYIQGSSFPYEVSRYDPPSELTYLNLAGDVPTDAVFTGTSSSCPVVAGFFACFLQNRRTWTALKLKKYVYEVLESQDTSKFYVGPTSTTVDDTNFDDYSSLQGGVARVPYLLEPPSIAITQNLAATTVVDFGDPVTLTIVATANAITGTLSYQWEKANSSSPSVYTDIPGATSASYTFTPQSPDQGNFYRCNINGTGGVDETTSLATTLSLTGLPSKTYLNAIDYTVLMGIKPKQYLYNRFGAEIYNKKEIFPKSFSIFSKQDAEIKIVRQKACPEFAYMHQEGYNWPLLPTTRRLKSKFSVNSFNTNDSNLNILANDATTHTATIALSQTLSDYRDLNVASNYSVIGNQPLRIAGPDLFQLAIVNKAANLTGGSFKLKRLEGGGYLSSRNDTLTAERVYLPFTYAQTEDFADGYEVEVDYFRRDQTLLSSVDVISDEFYIFWVGGSRGNGPTGSHAATMRIGFAWPDQSNTNSLIHSSRSKADWGIEMPSDPATSLTNRDDSDAVGYDGEKFYEGLPVDFVEDHSGNCLWVETNTRLGIDTYNVERSQYSDTDEAWDFNISVPGNEGGECHALGCKAGREVKEAEIVQDSEIDDGGNEQTIYYLQSPEPWPSLGEDGYQVTILDGNNTATVNVGAPTTRRVGDATVYWLRLGTSVPTGIVGPNVEVAYNLIYIATVDKRNRIQSFLVSAIAPGDIPYIRVFMQGRQGCSMGGMWIGQKTPQGIIVDPFTPHRSTVNIKDSGNELSGESFNPPETDGAIKTITTRTQNDQFGLSTAPTVNSTVANLDTNKSVHTSPKKCGSFLSRGGTDSAGILTPADYPIRWLTSNSSGLPLATFYVPKDESVEISLEEIFNVEAESVVNSDDANLATIFIARSLNNHDPVDSEKEIYMTLNYDEQ